MSGINKKTSRIFKSVLVSTVLFAFMLSAFAGCSDETEASSVADISQESQNVSSSDMSETISNEESSAIVSEESSKTESVDESNPQNESSSNEEISGEETSDGSQEESLPEDESSEASDESMEPEILGTGTKSDPFLMIPTEDKTVTTYTIPAGESQYYSIYRVGGTVLTIESEDVSVEYEGVPYISKKGKVTVVINYALASDAILFEIINEGESDQAFLLEFANPEGTMANPKKVTDITKDNKVSIPAGTETGYHFSYVAEKDGVLHFYMTSSVASALSATNNSTSANRTTEETDKEYVELEVKAGDEIIIVVAAQRDKRNNVPAVDITWHAIYA